MSSKNKYYKLVKGKWTHPTPLKKIVNPVLRLIQFYTDNPLVIASETKVLEKKDGTLINPRFIRYAIRRIKLLEAYK